MRIITTTAIAFILMGCAKSPESISASYVSPVQYGNWTCNQLGEEAARVNSALTQASEQQRKARTTDTLGVLFLGMPVSSLSGGNVSDQIASLKGQQTVIAQSATQKNCSLPTLPDPLT